MIIAKKILQKCEQKGFFQRLIMNYEDGSLECVRAEESFFILPQRSTIKC